MDNREMFRGDAFSKAWHEHQCSKQDLLRTVLMNPILEREMKSLAGKKILDAGAGNGFFIPNLKKMQPKKIWACDISPFLVNVIQREHPDVAAEVVDLLEKWPYETEFFDIVLAYNVIMDLPSIDNAIEELSRVLQKKGTAHVVVVHPIYNLFFNDQKAGTETTPQRVARYTKEESLLVDTIPGYPQFQVFRRPIQSYINAFAKNGLKMKHMEEAPIPEKLKENPKYAPRVGAPVFAYFILEKE